jgi:hypothetical protein
LKEKVLYFFKRNFKQMKILRTVKKIISRSGDLHFTRFAILEIPNFLGVYIHKIYKPDKDGALHSHPWNFLGIVLKGSYAEETVRGFSIKKFGTISFGTRHFFHKIQHVFETTTTLFLVFGRHEPWFYINPTESSEFRKEKHKKDLT